MDKIQRRKYLIDPSFQIKFILKFCAIVTASSLLLGGFVFLLTRGSTTVAIENTKVLVKPTSDFILPSLFLTVFIVSVFSAVVILFVALFITHKIVGPIFRLKREIELMKEGDMSRNFGLREKDQLQELAKSLSAMAGNFRYKHAELKNACHRVSQYLQERDFCVSHEDKEELNNMLREMDSALKYFKVE